MTDQIRNLKITAANIAPRKTKSVYPEPFASQMNGRIKRKLGDVFGLNSFGVNQTVLEPGAQSALMHRHAVQDEFVYVLYGVATLVTDQGETEMRAGDCAGFSAKGIAHQLVNRTDENVTYLEIGDRQDGDSAEYPNDDLVATLDGAGAWQFTHKDGKPY